MVTSYTGPTVQRQEGGKTVYLERTATGEYRETTAPGGPGSYSKYAGIDFLELAKWTASKPGPEKKEVEQVKTPKPSSQMPSKEERFKMIMATVPAREAGPMVDIRDKVTTPKRKQAVQSANQAAAQGKREYSEAQKYQEYAAKMPGGEQFGLRLGYTTEQALQKSQFTQNEDVRSFLRSTAGMVPNVIDLGAQAVKNTPDIFKAVKTDPVKFGGEGGSFILGNVLEQGSHLYNLPGRALSGETGARGELLGTATVLVGGALLHGAGRAKIKTAAKEQIPVGIKYTAEQRGGIFVESQEYVLASKPKGLKLIEGEARATYAKQITQVEGKGYIQHLEVGKATLKPVFEESPLAIAGKVEKSAGLEYTRVKNLEFAPKETLLVEGTGRRVAFRQTFEEGGAGLRPTEISPLGEQMQVRGTTRGAYKVEILEKPVEIIKRQDTLSPTTERTPAIRIEDVLPKKDIGGSLKRVRVEYELPDVKAAIKANEIKPAPTLTKKGVTFEVSSPISGAEITDVGIERSGLSQYSKTSMKAMNEVSIPSGLVKAAQKQSVVQKTAQKTATFTLAPVSSSVYSAEMEEEEQYTMTMPVSITSRQLTQQTGQKVGLLSVPRSAMKELSTPTQKDIVGGIPKQASGLVQLQKIQERGLNRQTERELTRQQPSEKVTPLLTQKTASLSKIVLIQKTGGGPGRKFPVTKYGSFSSITKRGGGDKLFSKIKFGKAKYRAGLQPMLSPLEKLRLEAKFKGPVRGLVKSTPKSRAIYRGSMLKGLVYSGLLKKTKKRRR